MIISLSLVLLLIIFGLVSIVGNNLTGRAIQRDYSQESKTIFQKIIDKIGFRRFDPGVMEDVFKLKGELETKELVQEIKGQGIARETAIQEISDAFVNHLDSLIFEKSKKRLTDYGEFKDGTNFERVESALNILKKTSGEKVFEKEAADFYYVLIMLEEALKSEIIEIDLPSEISSEEIYGFGIGGSFKFEQRDSLIRIILIDSDDKKYLVFEAYPLLDYLPMKTFSIEDYCEETCIFEEKITPKKLRVEIYGSDKNMLKINLVSLIKEAPVDDKTFISSQQERSKVKRLNNMIQYAHLSWTAASNEFSRSSYEIKESIKPGWGNSQGFEYYSEGVFEKWKEETESKIPLDESRGTIEIEKPTLIQRFLGRVISSNEISGENSEDKEECEFRDSSGRCLPDSWDWRNWQGGNGKDSWITPVGDQDGYGSCYAFSTTGTVEAVANLYYNQDINPDLSEQTVICQSIDSYNEINPSLVWVPQYWIGRFTVGRLLNYIFLNFGGGNPAYSLENVKTHGVEEEIKYGDVDCNYYTAGSEICYDYCMEAKDYGGTYEGDWRIKDYDGGIISYILATLSPTTKNDKTEIKKKLINGGPLAFATSLSERFDLLPAPHAMVLVGYRESDSLGTVWIVKNSWGHAPGKFGDFFKWGFTGGTWEFPEIPSDSLFIVGSTSVEEPYHKSIDHDIKCYDQDGDGFCNWGLTGFPLKENSWESENPMPESCEEVSYGISPDGGPGVYDTEWGCATLNPNMPDADDSNPLIGHYENDSYSGAVSDCLIHADCEQGQRCVWNEELKIRQCVTKCQRREDCWEAGFSYINNEGAWCQGNCIVGPGECHSDCVANNYDSCKETITSPAGQTCTLVWRGPEWEGSCSADCDFFPPEGAYTEN